MRGIVCFTFLFALIFTVNSQDSFYPLATTTNDLNSFTLATPQQKVEDTDIGKFALTVNPLGFIQFGPLIGADLGIKENLALSAHIRFPSLGVLTYVVKYHDDGLDKLNGIAFDVGILYFFGERKNKPYIGFFIGYQKTEVLYARNEPWEWIENETAIPFIFNGGYRFRFDGGFFINTGAFFGAASSKWDWYYSDSGYGTGEEGNSLTPFGMAEVTLGLEF